MATELDHAIKDFTLGIRNLLVLGYSLQHRVVGAVNAGDYLIYETKSDDETQVHCRRVTATGGEQGSGPTPDQYWLALEGDEKLQKHNGEAHVLALTKES